MKRRPLVACLLPVVSAFSPAPPSTTRGHRRRVGAALVPPAPSFRGGGGSSRPVALRASPRRLDDSGGNDGGGDKRRKMFLHVWAVGVSAFVVINAKLRPFPESLLRALTRQQWALVHAVASMLFSGTIVLSALLERLVVASKDASVMRFWFHSVPRRLDARVVLPALTGAMLSGVGQATIEYGGLRRAPRHVTGAFHCLVAFGMWWMVADVASQKGAAEAVRTWGAEDEEAGTKGEDVPRVLRRRAASNAVSVLFVVGLYALMVLKPGFGG